MNVEADETLNSVLPPCAEFICDRRHDVVGAVRSFSDGNVIDDEDKKSGSMIDFVAVVEHGIHRSGEETERFDQRVNTFLPDESCVRGA